jgi:YHS domain-containing protein
MTDALAEIVMLCLLLIAAADPAAAEPFKPLQSLVGEWKGTGTPETLAPMGKKKEFWTESVVWAYKIDKQGTRLVGTFEKSPHFQQIELKYDEKSKSFPMTATLPDKSIVDYSASISLGKQKETILTAEHTDHTTKDESRVIFTLLHSNRYLVRAESKPASAKQFNKQYQIGVTKQGEPFAAKGNAPECIVTGGQAKTAVSYKGVTYYVCCSGCKDAFLDDPEKYIAALKKK